MGSLAMLQIILSLPVSYFFYTFVFAIPVFMQMNILATFIVLGVGADDLFVLHDAWVQVRTLLLRDGRLLLRSLEPMTEVCC